MTSPRRNKFIFLSTTDVSSTQCLKHRSVTLCFKTDFLHNRDVSISVNPLPFQTQQFLWVKEGKRRVTTPTLSFSENVQCDTIIRNNSIIVGNPKSFRGTHGLSQGVYLLPLFVNRSLIGMSQGRVGVLLDTSSRIGTKCHPLRLEHL